MNKRICKKLKKAGFPFDWEWCLDERVNNWEEHFDCYPSLDELIEACGKEFEALGKSIISDKWIAYNRRDGHSVGKTPSEAVANLWLELNKK